MRKWAPGSKIKMSKKEKAESPERISAGLLKFLERNTKKYQNTIKEVVDR
jgi:hypothetical protein